MLITLKSLFFIKFYLHLLFYKRILLSIAGGKGYPL
jgi:hypothetical protein